MRQALAKEHYTIFPIRPNVNSHIMTESIFVTQSLLQPYSLYIIYIYRLSDISQSRLENR